MSDDGTENELSLLHCLGCKNECLYGSTIIEECQGTQCYIWPEKNNFLISGLKDVLSVIHEKWISQPVFFIDFNYHNIRFFLNGDWLAQFRGARLVLLTDKIMQPLAYYWFYHDSAETIISSVIVYDDDREMVIQKTKTIMQGKVTRPPRRMKMLSDNEYVMLGCLYRGENPKKMSKRIGVEVKSIYVAKCRIEQKLGLTIHELFF